ncbi:hypothetical protein D9M68_831800 [compost metagenome]
MLEERVLEHGDAIERCQQPFAVVGRGGRVELFADDFLDDPPGRRLVGVPLVEQVLLHPLAVFAFAAGGLHVDELGAAHLARRGHHHRGLACGTAAGAQRVPVIRALGHIVDFHSFTSEYSAGIMVMARMVSRCSAVSLARLSTFAITCSAVVLPS